MKSYFFVVSLSACAVAAAGCASDARRGPDFAVDLSVARDLSDGCTRFPSWPGDDTRAALRLDPMTGFDAETTLFAVGPPYPDGTTFTFEVGVYHPVGESSTFPRTSTFTALSSVGTTNDVATMLATDGKNEAIYFAHAGTLTIERANRTPGSGIITASGSGLRLDEVAETGSETMTDGCVDIDNFQLTADYAPSDGGADM